MRDCWICCRAAEIQYYICADVSARRHRPGFSLSVGVRHRVSFAMDVRADERTDGRVDGWALMRERWAVGRVGGQAGGRARGEWEGGRAPARTIERASGRAFGHIDLSDYKISETCLLLFSTFIGSNAGTSADVWAGEPAGLAERAGGSGGADGSDERTGERGLKRRPAGFVESFASIVKRLFFRPVLPPQ